MPKIYNYHKLARQTRFIKKPSSKEIRKEIRERKQSEHAYKEYSVEILNGDGTIREVIDKHDYHFGLFYAKGWKPIRLFKTKEEAEEYLEKFIQETHRENVRNKYAIREILEWGENQ